MRDRRGERPRRLGEVPPLLVRTFMHQPARASLRKRPVGEWLPELGSPVVGQGVFLPISAAARAELAPLALVVVIHVPNVQVKQAPERLHLRSIAHTPPEVLCPTERRKGARTAASDLEAALAEALRNSGEMPAFPRPAELLEPLSDQAGRLSVS